MGTQHNKPEWYSTLLFLYLVRSVLCFMKTLILRSEDYCTCHARRLLGETHASKDENVLNHRYFSISILILAPIILG